MVVSPELGTSAACWVEGSKPWLQTLLPELVPRPLIMEFKHNVTVNHAFNWESIVALGDLLLEQLLHHSHSAEVSRDPDGGSQYLSPEQLILGGVY